MLDAGMAFSAKLRSEKPESIDLANILTEAEHAHRQAIAALDTGHLINARRHAIEMEGYLAEANGTTAFELRWKPQTE